MARGLNPPPKRAEAIRIRLTSEMMDRTKRISGLLGLPIATLAAHALGSYVSQQERALALVDKVADTVGGEFGAALKHELAVQRGETKQLKLWHGQGKGKPAAKKVGRRG